MADKLNELLDSVGWARDIEWKRAAFDWMIEVTNRIQKIEYELERQKDAKEGS